MACCVPYCTVHLKISSRNLYSPKAATVLMCHCLSCNCENGRNVTKMQVRHWIQKKALWKSAMLCRQRAGGSSGPPANGPKPRTRAGGSPSSRPPGPAFPAQLLFLFSHEFVRHSSPFIFSASSFLTSDIRHKNG